MPRIKHATTPLLKTYRDYDLDGRLIRWELKNGVSYIRRDVVWDNASRVTTLKDLLATAVTNPNNPQVFGYDALDRLTTTTLGTTTTPIQTLAYDAIGNRTSATINGIMSTYNLPTNSHKLSSTVGGTNPRTFTYDAMGNLSNDGQYDYAYGNRGRINAVTWVAGTTTNTVTYDLNALGQRVRKTAPSSVGGTRRFMYDESGRLTGEYDSAGKLVQETVWLGDTPIATLRPKSGSITTPIAIDTFYVHADHLGTPRVITRPTDNKVVWSWENTEAFGNNAVNENPSALGAFKYNLRMPGQYWDKETGTFYNYYRDYDPSSGRYVQSDPIGLRGGINTYSYGEGRPLAFIDPLGLTGYAPARPLPPDPLRGGFDCDPSGNGGITIFLPPILTSLQLKCIGDCMRLHEELHIEELRKRDRRICKGKKNFERPTFDTKQQVKDSELRAYDAEMSCLTTKLNELGNCTDCKKTIEDRIKEIPIFRGRYE